MDRQRFVYFDAETGRIVHTTYYADGELPTAALSHHLVVPDGVDVAAHYVSSGALVLKPPQPSPHHTFDYTTKQWVDPRTPETEWPLVRAKRDRLIAATDWTQLPDVPLATKEVWANYRQALRDVTLQPDPFNIVWPVAP